MYTFRPVRIDGLRITAAHTKPLPVTPNRINMVYAINNAMSDESSIARGLAKSCSFCWIRALRFLFITSEYGSRDDGDDVDDEDEDESEFTSSPSSPSIDEIGSCNGSW